MKNSSTCQRLRYSSATVDTASVKGQKARQIAKKLATLLLTMERKVADIETGALYGSVSVTDVGEALGELGHEFARGDIHLEHPYK